MRHVSRVRLSAAVLTAVIPCFVFILAGIAKLDDPYEASLFVSNALGIQLGTAHGIVRAIAVIELLLAAGISLAIGRNRIPAYLGLCLLAFFVGLLIRVINLAPNASSCGCFGSLLGERLRGRLWTQVEVDIGLMVLLSIHIFVGGSSRKREAVTKDG